MSKEKAITFFLLILVITPLTGEEKYENTINLEEVSQYISEDLERLNAVHHGNISFDPTQHQNIENMLSEDEEELILYPDKNI